MNITHHISVETLLAYSAGTLQAPLALVVSVHLRMCDQCRTRHADALGIGGAMLEGLGGPRMPSAGLERCRVGIRERLDQAESSTAAAATDHGGGTRDPLLRQLPTLPDRLRWRPLTRGIQQVAVAMPGHRGNGWVRLFRFQPGVRVPHHGHHAEEFSLVLQGSYVDAIGRYSVGDLAELDGRIRHEPAVDSVVPCIALIGSTAGVDFDRPLLRTVSRIIGIG
ncbi:MAG: cupin domain-containing protein [Chromatiaceae bacterium]|nr:cupin domain-containing protein [Gammaproteobacteria bacterium]MCP5306448.1 cupin domain-containing protein [Chromatiaceae bacterium]MCP5312000.1 cupin domain-containing protein [Chromatiaceae bacterium]